MSETDLNEPDSEETAVTDPPRIPLRIWHWFVWIFLTMAVMTAFDFRSVEGIVSTGWLRIFQMATWASQTGLVLTATLSLALALRQRDLPREVKWCPGHFLIGISLISAITTVLNFLVIKFVSLSGSTGLLIMVVGLGSTVLVVATALFALFRVSTWRWRLFFAVLIAGTTLKAAVSYLLAGLIASTFYSVAITSISCGTISLLLLNYGAAVDAFRRPRPIYARAWTHWAGVLAIGISFAIEIAWFATMMINPPW